MNHLAFGGLVKLVMILCICSISFLNNGVWIALALLVLIGIVHLSFRRNIVNVFGIIMLFHWLQILCFIFYINYSWAGNPELFTGSSLKAYGSALTGVLVMCFVLHHAALRKLCISVDHLRQAAAKIHPKRAVYLCLVLYGVSVLANAAAFVLPVFTQLLLNLALLKWVGFVLMGYIAYYQKAFRPLFYLLFFFDFAAGFFSYFSSFKFVFFYSAVVATTFIRAVRFRTAVKALLLLGCLFILGVIWTLIKGDYRSFLNGGRQQQTVTVSQRAAYTKLSGLVTQISQEDVEAGVGELFYRLQYVFHLAKAVDNVPEKQPYENGSLWTATIRYATMPRLFDSEKPVYDASKKASKYTGIPFLGVRQGVSFSLGYFADCYVDFGIPGMFLALALLAFIWSKIFLFLVLKATGNLLLNYAIAAAFFIQFYSFEMDGTFLFGRLFTTFLFFLLLKYTLFPFAERYLTRHAAFVPPARITNL